MFFIYLFLVFYYSVVISSYYFYFLFIISLPIVYLGTYYLSATFPYFMILLPLSLFPIEVIYFSHILFIFFTFLYIIYPLLPLLTYFLLLKTQRDFSFLWRTFSSHFLWPSTVPDIYLKWISEFGLPYNSQGSFVRISLSYFFPLDHFTAHWKIISTLLYITSLTLLYITLYRLCFERFCGREL